MLVQEEEIDSVQFVEVSMVIAFHVILKDVQLNSMCHVQEERGGSSQKTGHYVRVQIQMMMPTIMYSAKHIEYEEKVFLQIQGKPGLSKISETQRLKLISSPHYSCFIPKITKKK